MGDIFPSALCGKKADHLTVAFGIRLSSNPVSVPLAKANGYDAIFIELEHSVLTEEHSNPLCTTALLAGVTSLVRVPYQCGDGFVQRVLDAGALGVILPHIGNEVEARAAVSISKYPPFGHRSMTGQLPQFSLISTPLPRVVAQANATGSAVIFMFESRSVIDNINTIAAVPGVDVLLIGSNDLSIELGMPGGFHSAKFKATLQAVSDACRLHGKTMGLAGTYDRPDLHGWAIHELGVRFILAQQDSGWIANGSKACIESIRKVWTPN